MKRRRWDFKTKTKIVLEGLSGRPVSKICNEYGTERMIRTMKEELFWLREGRGEAELGKELDKWVDYYNRSYLHSAHGYRTPIQAEEDYYKNHTLHKNAA